MPMLPHKWVRDVEKMKRMLKAVLVLAAGIPIGLCFAISLMPDVYIVPFENVPVDAAQVWGEYMAHDLDIRVKVLDTVAYPSDSFNFMRRQFIAEALADSIVRIRQNMLFKKPQAAFIGIITRDMYPTSRDWRYCYALNLLEGERKGISIVSTERLIPAAGNDQQVFNVRFYKLLKRAIGFQFYQYNATMDRDTVMYGPLLSVEDLDRMGTKY